MKNGLPRAQRAVQLVGPNALRLNSEKPVSAPGPNQIVCRVEAVGLCFSDLKLLKQFSSHPRKAAIVSGVGPEVLAEIPSYVPGDAPTVPGHETVVRVCAVGDRVSICRPGERYLVQTDYRWLRTPGANAAFGYNFEGALQEYVLMDERVITSPAGESMLIPAPEHLSASAIALVEPWACVEDAYATRERQRLKDAGRMLVVAEEEVCEGAFTALLARWGRPGEITWVSPRDRPAPVGLPVKEGKDLAELPEAGYDDVIYFGSRPETVETLFGKLAAGGLLNVALCGGRLARPVALPVGRVHYAGIRIVGTMGDDPADSMKTIRPSGEIRAGDAINVVGAGGPMGVMHVIRNLSLGLDGLTLVASDVDDERLSALGRIAGPLAAESGVAFRTCSPVREAAPGPFTQTIILVPQPSLVAQAVKQAAEGGVINIFAGIPPEVTAEVDLGAYIGKRLYLIGTSGSTLQDMRAVLAKVEAGRLDTNLSVAAVSGLEGAADGMRAIESREVSGKIVVYPECRGLGLVRLEELEGRLPSVAAFVERGLWNPQAERELLRVCGAPRAAQ